MHRNLIILTMSTAFISGCASSLQTYDATGKKTPGVAVYSPLLVEVTTKIEYEVDPSNKKYVEYCKPELKTAYDFLPLGEKSFITFDSASLGKSEFKVEFSDKGILKTVALNSDPAAGVEQVTGLLGTVLPYIAKPKADIGGAAIEPPDSAQKIKEKYCIKTSEMVISIKRLNIE